MAEGGGNVEGVDRRGGETEEEMAWREGRGQLGGNRGNEWGKKDGRR